MARNAKTLNNGGIVLMTKTRQRSRNVPKGMILVKVKYGLQKPEWILMSLGDYLQSRSKDDEGSAN